MNEGVAAPPVLIHGTSQRQPDVVPQSHADDRDPQHRADDPKPEQTRPVNAISTVFSATCLEHPMGQDAMTTFSLREAAEQARTSKSTIWRAIKSGRMSATRTDDGGFAIDPAELFRVFQPERPLDRPTGQDATPLAPDAQRPATLGTGGEISELAVTLAAAEEKIEGLKALLAEVRASRDELRQDRDEWRGRAERLLTDQRRPWWRRLAGG